MASCGGADLAWNVAVALGRAPTDRPAHDGGLLGALNGAGQCNSPKGFWKCFQGGRGGWVVVEPEVRLADVSAHEAACRSGIRAHQAQGNWPIRTGRGT